MKATRNYNDIDWKEVFYYDETSPSCLRWKNDVCSGQYKQFLNKSKHSEAGSLTIRKCGYSFWTVGHKKKTFFIHRIIWCLLRGSISDLLVIDHLDGDASNNKIINLSLKSNDENRRNMKMNKNNTTGMTGVSLITKRVRGIEYKYFRASVSSNKTRLVKLFNIEEYANAFELACEWRKERIKELNEQGAGYTERHGT